MIEGWMHDDYLVLLTEDESRDWTGAYKLDSYLPGYRVMGLKGWDDFIVSSADGGIFTVPTVPAIRTAMAPWSLPSSPGLEPDERFTRKIKWYIKPLIFGGDVSAKDNMTWLDHKQHAQLVTWWNDLYRAHSSSNSGG